MNINMADPLTAIFKLRACTEVQAFCLYVSPKPRGDENHRPGFDNWRSQLDGPGAQRTGCPEGASKASQSPLTAISKLRACTEVRAFSLYVSPKPRRGRIPDRVRHKSYTSLRNNSAISRQDYSSLIFIRAGLDYAILFSLNSALPT